MRAETFLESPVGTLRLAASESGLTHVLFAREAERAGEAGAGRSPGLNRSR